jgi:nitrogen fixation protein FixH
MMILLQQVTEGQWIKEVQACANNINVWPEIKRRAIM